MVKIIYVEADGNMHTVEARVGQSVMEAALRNKVPGIAADCGGACACATCRVYVDEAWRETTGEPGGVERSMIEFSDDTHPNVRLSCQIRVSEALDGLVVRIPASQH